MGAMCIAPSRTRRVPWRPPCTLPLFWTRAVGSVQAAVSSFASLPSFRPTLGNTTSSLFPPASFTPESHLTLHHPFHLPHMIHHPMSSLPLHHQHHRHLRHLLHRPRFRPGWRAMLRMFHCTHPPWHLVLLTTGQVLDSRSLTEDHQAIPMRVSLMTLRRPFRGLRLARLGMIVCRAWLLAELSLLPCAQHTLVSFVACPSTNGRGVP